MTKRFSYNPFNKKFIDSNDCHSLAILNNNKNNKFDDFIRCIIHNNILYIRLYYPFNDITEKTISEINHASIMLLKENKTILLKLIKKHYDVKINDIKFNVINDLLKKLKLANI